MKKIIFAVSILILLFVFLADSHAYVSLTVSGQPTSSIIEAGEKTNLVVTISNSGNEVARNVKLKIRPHPYVTPDQYQYEVGTVAVGSSQVLVVPIKISENALEGSTALILEVSYETDTAGTSKIEGSAPLLITKRVFVQIESVTFSKEIIQKGDEVEMNIVFKNLGRGRIRDLRASLEDFSLPFVYVESSKYLGNVAQGVTFNVSFTLIVKKQADTIAYSIPVNLSYYDEAGSLRTERKYATIKISGTPEFVVNFEEIRNGFAGRTADLTFSVANRGTASAEFLTLRFDSNFNVIPKEFYVGNLDPDDLETITVAVDLTGASIGKNDMSIEFLYRDSYNNEYQQNKTISFNVAPPTGFDSFLLIIIVVVLAVVVWKRKFILSRILKKK